MELLLHEYELPLKHPFTISRGTTTAQPTLIVELQQDGVSGYGEAIANTYYNSPMDSMRARLQSVQTMLAGETFRDTESFWKLCAERLADASFVLSALDCAAHDLWGRLEGMPVHRLWGLDPADAVNSSYTIGIAGVEKDGGQARRDAGVAGVQNQARHRARRGNHPSPARAHRGRVSHRCQLRLGSG